MTSKSSAKTIKSMAGTERLAEKSADFNRVQGALDKSGLRLVPQGWRWPDEPCHGFPVHFVGMLMTVGLLTFGATLWFNILRSLTNLRSVVAKKISKEETKKTSGTAPVTVRPPGVSPPVLTGSASSPA